MVGDLVLLLGSTLRLTRLVVVDDLGRWWLKAPLWRAVSARGADTLTLAYLQGQLPEFKEPEVSWTAKLVSGLECPFCVGFWLGTLNTGLWLLTRQRPGWRGLWRFGAGVLTLNEVAAHLGVRLGDTAD